MLCLMSVSASATFTKRNIQSRIVNGAHGHWGQFPYYAYLETTNRDDKIGTCGGIILSENWILTAAHCLEHMKKVVVHVGAVSRENVMEPGRQVFEASWPNLKSHFFYSNIRNFPSNDIGVIKLSSKIQFSYAVQPVRMPQSCEYNEHNYAIVMGFGGNATNNASDYLQWTTLTTVPTRECRKLDKFIEMRDGVSCAICNLKSSMCAGDGGSPIVGFNDGVLIGIAMSISYPNGCKAGEPQTFTNIIPHLTWIGKQTGLNLPQCSLF